MDSRLLKHVLSYEDIYRFVSEQDRTEDEVKACLENQGKAESTVRTFIQNIKKKDDPGLFSVREGMIVIDDVKGRKLIDDLKDILSLPADDEILSNALKEADALKSEIYSKEHDFVVRKQQLEELHEQELLLMSQQLEDVKEQVKQSKKEIAKLKRERNKFKKQVDGKMDFIYQSINQKVLLVNSISIGPLEKPENAALLEDVRFLIDVEPTVVSAGGTRDSFYTDMKTDEKKDVTEADREDGKELCEENHQRKSIRRILTDLILRKRAEENKSVEVESLQEELYVAPQVEPKEDEKEITKVDAFRKQRVSYIQSIVDNKNLSNQEKLALYAFYSDFHGKDMERLINFAGDYSINANLLIQLLESPGRACSIQNVENMLRQFVKASQVRLKLDFAKELIDGEWYIAADYNGQKTKFQLVPLEEFNELRKAMDLPESLFGYEKNPTKTSNSKAETVKPEAQKPYIARFNCLDDAEEDIPDQDCEADENEEVHVGGK